MNFANLDPMTFAMFIIETIVLVGIIALSAVSLFKLYKGKNKLTVTDLLQLQQDLTTYANTVYKTISVWSDLNPSNFSSMDEYREFLIKRIVEDFDDLVQTDPDCPINSSIYGKLSKEDKLKLAEFVANKILGMSTNNTDDDSIEEEVKADDNSETESDYTDIGDHLI